MIIMVSLCNSASADTCYDPQYGYFECHPTNYYQDQGYYSNQQDQAVIAATMFGFILGSFANDNDDGYHGGNNWGYGHGGNYRHGNWNGNGHGDWGRGGHGGHHH